jgi:hypothetical protein
VCGGVVQAVTVIDVTETRDVAIGDVAIRDVAIRDVAIGLAADEADAGAVAADTID